MPDHHNEVSGRRPLKVRSAGLAKVCAVWLSSRRITPNQISLASVFFAALASGCLLFLSCIDNVAKSGAEGLPKIPLLLLPLAAAVFIQLRLLCNLFDGMVAVEGGKGTPAGELFNDIPDRFADPMILVAAGYTVASSVSWGPTLGWCAGLLSVMTAYIRTLGASIGAPVDFQGPMAKQHRMALMTAACLASAVEGYFQLPGYGFLLALLLIVAGCILTIFRRCRSAYLFLENRLEDHRRK